MCAQERVQQLRIVHVSEVLKRNYGVPGHPHTHVPFRQHLRRGVAVRVSYTCLVWECFGKCGCGHRVMRGSGSGTCLWTCKVLWDCIHLQTCTCNVWNCFSMAPRTGSLETRFRRRITGQVRVMRCHFPLSPIIGCGVDVWPFCPSRE
jgi:hypothetical protein